MNVNIRTSKCNFVKIKSGAIVQFNATHEYDLGVSVKINAIQMGSGDPSPVNFRDIGGQNVIDISQSWILPGESPETIEFRVILGRTVYGATFDAKTGIMVINREIVKLDGSQTVVVASPSYIKSDASDGFVTVNSIQSGFNPEILPDDLLCDSLKFVKVAIWSATGYSNCCTINAKQIHMNIANDVLGIVDYTQETIASVRNKITSYLTNNPISFIVPIDPITIQLDPIEIMSKIGTNSFNAGIPNIITIQCVDI